MATTECPRCHYPRVYTADTSSFGANQDDNPTLVLHAESFPLRQDKRCTGLDQEFAAGSIVPYFPTGPPPIDFSTHQVESYRRYKPEPLEHDTYHTEEDYHYSLITVCRRWRGIALSTPHLWTSIALGLANSPDTIQAQISLLDFHFNNARNIPISVEVDFRDLELNSRGDSVDRKKSLSIIDPLMMAILIRRSTNIRNLLLIQPPIETLTLIDMNLSRCESMTISRPSFGEGWLQEFPNFSIDFSPLQCLRDVHLMDCTAMTMFPPTMTSCRLLSSHIDTCLNLLVTYPNFITFESMEPLIPQNSISHNFTGPVTLPNLEELTWSCVSAVSNNDCSLFLEFIRFSKLRTLEWCDDEQYFPFRSPRLHFFASLPTTLTSITFNQCHYDNGGIIEQLLYYVPQVTELHFIECDPVTVTFIIQFIGRPLPQSEDSFSIGYRPAGLTVLPNLRKLSIDDPETLDVYEPGDFIEMFKALHARGISERFYLTLSPEIDWDPDSRSEIKAVLSSGFNAKIDLGFRILE